MHLPVAYGAVLYMPAGRSWTSWIEGYGGEFVQLQLPTTPPDMLDGIPDVDPLNLRPVGPYPALLEMRCLCDRKGRNM